MNKLVKLLSVAFLMSFSLVMVSCDDDDSSGGDWTDAQVSSAISKCVSEGNSQEDCECYINKVSEEVDLSTFENGDDAELSPSELAAGLTILEAASECGVSVFTAE